MRQSLTVKAKTILEPSDKDLSAVTEVTLYPADFPTFLRGQMQGKTIAEVAGFLEVPEEHVVRLLDGLWRPTKDICRRMGLKTVYAITGMHGEAASVPKVVSVARS